MIIPPTTPPPPVAVYSWYEPIQDPAWLDFHDPSVRFAEPERTELADFQPAPYAEFEGDPAKFLRDVVGIRLYPKQETILEATIRHRLVTVSSCHSAGKSFLAACALVYNFNCYRPMLGMSTAPGFNQVRGLIWREVGTIYNRSKKPLAGTLLTVRLEGDKNWFAEGIAAKDPNRFQGRHGVRVFIVVDEAQGIQNPKIWEAIEANTSGGDAYILILGNPVADEGFFYDSHHTDDRWERFQIDAHETPNIVDRIEVVRDERWVRYFSGFDPNAVGSGAELVAGLASREWVERMRRKTGGKGREWTTRVLGQFYKGADEITDGNRIGPKAWLEAAVDRWAHLHVEGQSVHLGVDVGGDGKDESVIAWRRGRKVEGLKAWPDPSSKRPTWKPNVNTLGRLAFKKALKLRAASIAFDMGGGWGAGSRASAQEARRGFLRELKRLKQAGQWGPEQRELLRWARALQIIGVVPTKKPRDPERYRYLRDEVWHHGREMLDPTNKNCWGLPKDEGLLKQLNRVFWGRGRDAKDKIWVASHDSLVKKGLGSPDRAQAVVLTGVTESVDGPPPASVMGDEVAPAPAPAGERKPKRVRVTRNGMEIRPMDMPGGGFGPRWRQAR